LYCSCVNIFSVSNPDCEVQLYMIFFFWSGWSLWNTYGFLYSYYHEKWHQSTNARLIGSAFVTIFHSAIPSVRQDRESQSVL
jgi:hypothetical protein